MLFWFALGVLGALIFSVWWSAFDWSGIFWGVFASVLSVALVFFVVMGLSYLVGLGPSEGQRVTGKTMMYALDFGQETHGSVFLVTQDDTIRYISKAEDGGMSVESVDASMSTIYENIVEDQKPYVEQYIEQFDMGWVAPWLGVEDKSYWNTTYKFHVPEGTVVSGYSVDLSE